MLEYLGDSTLILYIVSLRSTWNMNLTTIISFVTN